MGTDCKKSAMVPAARTNPSENAPKPVAEAVLNALRGGVVPRVGLPYITVGRVSEINALLSDMALTAGGGGCFRLIAGRYGAGKSFLLQTMRNYALDKGFAVLDCDLSPEKRLTGGGGRAVNTYRELIANMSVKAAPGGGALPLILDDFADGAPGQAPADALRKVESLPFGFEFSAAVSAYRAARRENDAHARESALRLLTAGFASKTDAKRALGVNFIVTDDNWYDFLKLFAVFAASVGYAGVLVFIDELVNIFKIPNAVTRQGNYEKILQMYNDTLQGKAKHLGFFMSPTLQAIEDKYKGMHSYEALRTRLAAPRLSEAAKKFSPVIHLEPLDHDELYVLLEKLKTLYENCHECRLNLSFDDYVAFLNAEYNREGAATHITPREIIRDFLSLADFLRAAPGETVSGFLADGGGLSAEAPEETIYAAFMM